MPPFMKYLICSAFLLVSGLLVAQQKYSVSGTVKDGANGETIFGASVYLEGTSIGTVTNEYGFFSLAAPEGEYTLVVSFVGFQEIRQSLLLDGNQSVDFELGQQSTSLDEVVIEGGESERTDIRSPQMGVAKLKVATIKQIPAVLGEVDVIKSLQLLPGVTNSGEGTGGFNVRGGASDQNLVLLDEAIIYNTSHLFGFFSVFNADAVKDIKLYKGAIPPRFGGRVSSVLDIRQKDGNSKEYAFTGGIGLISSRLAAEGPLPGEKGSFLIAGRGSYAHLFLKAADIDNIAYFYDMNLKGNYDLNKNNKLYVSGYLGRDVFDLSGIINSSYGNLSGNLRWNHIFNEKLFSNLSFIYGKYDYRIILNFIGLDWVADIENYNLKYDLEYYLNENITLDFGLSGISYDFNPGSITPSSETSAINALTLDQKRAVEGALYVNAEHKLGEKLTVMYGARYSAFSRLGGQALNNYANGLPVVYNEALGIYEAGEISSVTEYSNGDRIKSYGNLEPRLAAAFQLNDVSSVKAGYTRSAQYIHLISNTTTATPLDVWAPSGKFIKPQLSDQYALGYFADLKDRAYSLETEVYYKTVSNRIDYIDGSNLIGNNTVETEILNGESRAYGLEVLLRKNSGKLTGWVAYTLSKAEQRTPGGAAGGMGINEGEWYRTAYDRTHDISITGSYKLNERWTFSGNAIFQTGRPVTYPNAQYQYEGLSIAGYSGRNENRLPAYHRVDIAATYKPGGRADKRWQGEWVFSIYNLYDRKNAASISFGQNRETGTNEATRTAIFGIIPSVTYNFKF